MTASFKIDLVADKWSVKAIPELRVAHSYPRSGPVKSLVQVVAVRSGSEKSGISGRSRSGRSRQFRKDERISQSGYKLEPNDLRRDLRIDRDRLVRCRFGIKMSTAKPVPWQAWKYSWKNILIVIGRDSYRNGLSCP